MSRLTDKEDFRMKIVHLIALGISVLLFFVAGLWFMAWFVDGTAIHRSAWMCLVLGMVNMVIYAITGDQA